MMSTEGKYFCTTDLELAKEVYEALDKLLKAIGNLPMNYIVSRPPLHKAHEEGTNVIDRAVKEGRYVSTD